MKKFHNVIGMNTELKEKAKKILKIFFEVDEQCSFLKNYGECEKYGDIKLVKIKARRKILVSGPK